MALENYTNEQASALMEETRRIMEEAEATGEDPEDKLREVVERAVREGIVWGGAAPALEEGQDAQDGEGAREESEAKRRRE